MKRIVIFAAVGVLAASAFGAHATITNTPYNPSSDTTLKTFSNGNENVAETTTFVNDPNGLGFDFSVKTDPAGLVNDHADNSIGEQFTNVYFGNPADGAQVVFELGNDRAFNLATGAVYNYAPALGITYSDLPGTPYANGGQFSESQTFIPYAGYNTVLTNLGLAPVPVGGTIQVRDLQAFSYGGNNAGGGERFGSITIPAAVSAAPEPAAWALLMLAVGVVGASLRLHRRQGVAASA